MEIFLDIIRQQLVRAALRLSKPKQRRFEVKIGKTVLIYSSIYTLLKLYMYISL